MGHANVLDSMQALKEKEELYLLALSGLIPM